MSRIRTLPLSWTTVTADDDTDELFHPATPWMMASEVEKVRVTFELRAVTNSFQGCVGYQAANIESSPGSHGKIGAVTATEGVAYPTGFTDISSTTQGKQLLRFGFVGLNSSGTTLGTGRMAAVIEVMEC